RHRSSGSNCVMGYLLVGDHIPADCAGTKGRGMIGVCGQISRTAAAALATVVGVLIEVPVMLSLVRIINARKGWLEQDQTAKT
ncbi:MAG: hypothetical protein SH859_12210, partial [Hyphomicrobium aestuarii]|nr:hypothetical protein [Hyphomicrobium aestuarii]